MDGYWTAFSQTSFIQSRTREDFVQKPRLLSIGFEVDNGVRIFAGRPWGGSRESRARVLFLYSLGKRDLDAVLVAGLFSFWAYRAGRSVRQRAP